MPLLQPQQFQLSETLIVTNSTSQIQISQLPFFYTEIADFSAT